MHANGLYRVINKPYHIAPYHTIFSLILSQIMWYHMFLIKYNVLSENYLKFKYRLGYGYSMKRVHLVVRSHTNYNVTTIHYPKPVTVINC